MQYSSKFLAFCPALACPLHHASHGPPPPLRGGGTTATGKPAAFTPAMKYQERFTNRSRPSPGPIETRCEREGKRSAAVEGGHDLAGEPLQLFDELARRQAFGPMDHEILDAGVLRLDRFDALDHLSGRAAEPGLLLHPLTQGRHRRGRAGGAPSAALRVGVAPKAERREPFVALVMRRLETADRLFLGVGEIDAGAPDHVLPELHVAPMLEAGLVEGLHDIVEDLFAVQGHHRL